MFKLQYSLISVAPSARTSWEEVSRAPAASTCASALGGYGASL